MKVEYQRAWVKAEKWMAEVVEITPVRRTKGVNFEISDRIYFFDGRQGEKEFLFDNIEIMLLRYVDRRLKEAEKAGKKSIQKWSALLEAIKSDKLMIAEGFAELNFGEGFRFRENSVKTFFWEDYVGN